MNSEMRNESISDKFQKENSKYIQIYNSYNW